MEFEFSKNLKTGFFWLGLFKTVGQVFIWLNTIIIARFLHPSDYGLVGMANLITTFVVLIGDFGFGTAIVQEKDLKPIHVHSLFWIIVAIGMAFLLVLYFGAPIAAMFFDNSEVLPILQLSVVAMFFNIISDIPVKLLLRDLRYRSSGLLDFASNLAASISVLILAIRGYGAYSLVFGAILTGFLKFSLACLQCRWFPKATFQKQGLKKFVKFGGNIVTSRILWYIYSNADYAILAKKLGKIPFGLYSFAFNFACIPINKLRPILYPVLFSSFSKIQDDLPQLREKYLKIVDFMFTCYVLIYCGLFWVSPEFVKIFLGDQWEPIIPVLQILLIAQPLRALSSSSPPVTVVLGRPDIGVKNMIVFITIMVPSFLIFSNWGTIGVGLAWCFVYPIAFLITLIMRLRVVGIPLRTFLLRLVPSFKFVLVTSLAIFVYKSLLVRMYSSPDIIFLWVSFLGTILVGTFSNFFVLWVFEKRYINMVFSFIKS